MPFFEFCVKCRQTFNSKKAWESHISSHQQPGKKAAKGADKKYSSAEIAEANAAAAAANVPGADPNEAEDVRLKATKELREMKKHLNALGIECATMNAEETRAAFEKAKEEGLID